MNIAESIGVWEMKSDNEVDYNTFFTARFLNEIRFFSDNKSKLYDIVYKMDDGHASEEEIKDANKYICEMNACLRSAHELYLHGQEVYADYKTNSDVFMAWKFVCNFESGIYDHHFACLCERLEEKILKSDEL